MNEPKKKYDNNMRGILFPLKSKPVAHYNSQKQRVRENGEVMTPEQIKSEDRYIASPPCATGYLEIDGVKIQLSAYHVTTRDDVRGYSIKAYIPKAEGKLVRVTEGTPNDSNDGEAETTPNYVDDLPY